jgi:hypothetical protein
MKALRTTTGNAIWHDTARALARGHPTILRGTGLFKRLRKGYLLVADSNFSIRANVNMD